jgi:hypothetical protein
MRLIIKLSASERGFAKPFHFFGLFQSFIPMACAQFAPGDPRQTLNDLGRISGTCPELGDEAGCRGQIASLDGHLNVGHQDRSRALAGG